MKLILVSENVSVRMGGEAQKSHYFLRYLLRRGVDVQVVTHARVRAELNELYAHDKDILSRFHFVEYSQVLRWFWRIFRFFPPRIQGQIGCQISHLVMIKQARPLVKNLIEQGGEIIWEPIPISPRSLSLRFGLGVPEVFGPLAGGMTFPPSFRFLDSRFVRVLQFIGHAVSSPLHKLCPGKLKADALIVANKRTANALPAGITGRIYYDVPESGVDLDQWTPKSQRSEGPVRFIFVGRFDKLKGLQYLVQSFSQVADQIDATLELVGDGEMRLHLEEFKQQSGVGARIILHGWQSRAATRSLVQACDVFVLPSLRESGGNALLEAMAAGLPIITVNWGGPGDYITDECGIRVNPSEPETFVADLGKALIRLAQDKELRRQMGEAGTRRVRTCYFDWDAKTGKILEILQDVLKN